MRFADAVRELDARTNYETSGRLTSPSLDRIKMLMDVLGEPHRSFQALHITGTNGKSTVARAATEVLRGAGLSVGTFTSPHVSSITERIMYDGRAISEAAFADAWEGLKPFLDIVDARADRPVTWFEAITALAFSVFADNGVDVAVIEVGMGGSWDATNVVDASVAAITRVAVDHPELGATPEEIAREKAGIIKADAVLYTVVQDPSVLDVLIERCDAVGAEMRAEPMAFELESSTLALGGQAVDMRIGKDRYSSLFVPMFGEHFARDVMLGAAAARSLLGDASLEEDLLTESLATLRVPGRMEVAHRSPLVVLDGAHNPAAAAALARELPAAFKYDRLLLVVSIMDDKDVRGVLAELAPIADRVIVTRNTSPRAASPERLRDEVQALGADATVVPTVPDAVSVALEHAGDADCVVVSGSLYTVGEARAVLVPAAKTPKET